MCVLPALAYPPSPGQVVDPDLTIANPGATVYIEGTNWGPGTVIEVVYEDNAGDNSNAAAASLGTAQADETGAFTAAVTVPADAPNGALNLQVVGTDADGTTSSRPFTLTVDDRAAPTGASTASAATSPATESAATFWTVGNAGLVALVAVGIAMLFFGPIRRRRSEQ